MSKDFYVVLRDMATAPSGWRNAITTVHTEASAREEAERLARKHDGTFWVLRAVASVGPTAAPLEWTEVDR